MPSFSLRIDHDLATLHDRGARAVHQAVAQVTDHIEGEARDEAPVVTGNLRHSITSRVSGIGFRTHGEVRATAPYAQYVHQGTGLFGPHHRKIVPREKKALRFVAGGQILFRRSVRGQRPNPFMDRALETVSPDIPSIVDRAIEAHLGGGV